MTSNPLLRCLAIAWFLIAVSLWDKSHGIAIFFGILAFALWSSLPPLRLPRTPKRRHR